VIKTAVGSRCGSQTIGALFAGSAGSKGKAQTPSQHQRLGVPSLSGSSLDGCPIVAPVVGISSKELPREFGWIELADVVIGGLRPPASRLWHVIPHYASGPGLLHAQVVACSLGVVQPQSAALAASRDAGPASPRGGRFGSCQELQSRMTGSTLSSMPPSRDPDSHAPSSTARGQDDRRRSSGRAHAHGSSPNRTRTTSVPSAPSSAASRSRTYRVRCCRSLSWHYAGVSWQAD
jgi:hypothetical protein